MMMDVYFPRPRGPTPELCLRLPVEDLGAGAGRVRCIECRGDPNYPRLFPAELGIDRCVDCKGAGWIYVSV